MIISEAAFSGDNCLACTSCIANCPVVKVSPKYIGPKLLSPAHGRLHFSQEDIEETLNLCSNCKNCDRSCPSGVAVSTLNMLQRATYYKKYPHSKCDDLLAHGERMAKLVRKIPLGATFANFGMNIGKKLGIFASIEISDKINMPAYAPKSFKNLFGRIKQQPYQKKVVFFHGCFINENEPQVGLAFLKVMQANGYEVLLDEKFNCCGSPMIVAGYFDETREHANNNTNRILEWKNKNIPIVTCCTSCSLMLKQEYRELFGETNIAEAAENVYDVFEFLELIDEKNCFNQNFKSLDETLLHHVPCHLKSQGLGVPAARILDKVPQLKIDIIDVVCCGMSGSYGFRKDKYEISMRIGEKLFEYIKTRPAQRVISDCGTCRLQIRHGTKTNPCHPIEILAAVYDDN